MPPQLPYLVYGTIKDRFDLTKSNIIIWFSTSSGKIYTTSDYTGKYVIDLANAGYTNGETVTYISESKNKNQKVSGSFVLSGFFKELNLFLDTRKDYITPGFNSGVVLCSIGGKPISHDNPLHVSYESEELLTYFNDFSGAVTNQEIIAPKAGYRIEIFGITVSTETVNVNVSILNNGNVLYKLYTAKTMASATSNLHLLGDFNESIKLTCGAGTFVLISYHYST